MKFDGVIFDLDGVLCRTDRYHLAAWQTLAGRLDIAMPPDAAERGSAVHAVLASLPLRPLESAALRAHGAALVRDGRLSAAQEAALPYDALVWLAGSPLWARMADSPRCERELPFSHLIWI